MKKVAIIDFKLGNIYSVVQACQEVGLNVSITSNYDEILAADGVILPGVGAFGDAINNLKELNLDKTIKDFVNTGKPFMGICLGLQLLFSESEEFGDYEGLGLIEGKVVKFDNSSFKVPQIAWNRINENEVLWIDTPLNKTKNGEFMYFVHSYYVIPDNPNYILTTTNYCGVNYCSSIKKDNIFATQFHPEKSGEKGLEIYKEWSLKL
ncbi:imidazole glycerol phosphate synthase subunit HisH [Tenacibaculum sp.]|uniref:imidazole glycerol phosphate synthase subunit HisH n=1 Tax=Tenacibaculum sp. TaxID=1906242 RepID=UPI003D0EA1D9